MKIKIVKHSGNPVNAEVYEAYKAEFATRFDEIQRECGADMQLMHEMLEMLDGELSGSYSNIEEVEYPKSARASKKLAAKYGHYMTTTNTDTNELVFVILDEGMQI